MKIPICFLLGLWSFVMVNSAPALTQENTIETRVKRSSYADATALSTATQLRQLEQIQELMTKHFRVEVVKLREKQVFAWKQFMILEEEANAAEAAKKENLEAKLEKLSDSHQDYSILVSLAADHLEEIITKVDIFNSEFKFYVSEFVNLIKR